jgi:hypothetical protein
MDDDDSAGPDDSAPRPPRARRGVHATFVLVLVVLDFSAPISCILVGLHVTVQRKQFRDCVEVQAIFGDDDAAALAAAAAAAAAGAAGGT